MNQAKHPETERLQSYAEARLAEGERAALASHLQACARCTAEVAEWRDLFASLAALPPLAPSVGFADRVMAQVRMPRKAPAYAAVLQQAGRAFARVIPQTTAGWALAAAFLALPVLLGGGVLVWLFSRDYLTPATLWTFLTDRATTGLQSLGSATLAAIMQTDMAAWLVRQSQQLLGTAGLSGLGLLAALVAAMTTLSIWILYKNLVRTPTRESNYVSYSF